MKNKNKSIMKIAVVFMFLTAMAIVTAIVLLGNSTPITASQVIVTYIICCAVFGGIILFMSS